MRLTVPLCAAVLLVTACQSAPAPVTDGAYRAFASSLGTVDDSMVVIDASVLTVTTGDIVQSARVGDADGTYTLCPPEGTGEALRLDQPLTIGELVLAEPAVFGDCGATQPARVTIVDLDSAAETTGPFPFTRWMEFCDVTDPDC
jgi:hypothetical protein